MGKALAVFAVIRDRLSAGKDLRRRRNPGVMAEPCGG